MGFSDLNDFLEDVNRDRSKKKIAPPKPKTERKHYKIISEDFSMFLESLEEGETPSAYSNNLIDDFEYGTLDDALDSLPPPPKNLGESEKLDEISPADIQKDLSVDVLDDVTKLKDKQKGKGVAAQTARLIHNSTVKAITDESGSEWDLEQLIGKLSHRPVDMLAQNSKIAISGAKNAVFYNFGLPAYHGLFFDETTKEFKLVKTCPSAGACQAFCYASKGGYVMFPGSSLKTGSILNFLLNDPEGFKTQLVDEINLINEKNKKTGKKLVIRWHDSGDFFNDSYTDLAFEVARETPDVKHYAYTKQVNIMRNKEIPDNFIISFSTGGTQDKSILPTDKQADVIPKPLFKGLNLKDINDQDILKDRAAEKLNLERDSIITYDELIKIPESDEPQYNVLVWKGHGDDAATRKDVIGTLLLAH